MDEFIIKNEIKNLKKILMDLSSRYNLFDFDLVNDFYHLVFLKVKDDEIFTDFTKNYFKRKYPEFSNIEFTDEEIILTVNSNIHRNSYENMMNDFFDDPSIIYSFKEDVFNMFKDTFKDIFNHSIIDVKVKPLFVISYKLGDITYSKSFDKSEELKNEIDSVRQKFL